MPLLDDKTPSNHGLNRVIEFCSLGLGKASLDEEHLMRFHRIGAKESQNGPLRFIDGRLGVVNTSPPECESHRVDNGADHSDDRQRSL